jgi:methyl-accepting chemotaxis protein
MNIANLRIGARLAIVFALQVALTLVIGGFALRQISNINANTEDISGNWLASIKQLGDMRDTINDIRRAELQNVIALDVDEKKQYADRVEAAKPKLQKVGAEFEALLDSPAEHQAWDKYQSALKAFYDTDRHLRDLSDKGPQEFDETMKYLRGDSNAAFTALDTVLDAMLKLNVEGAERVTSEAKNTYTTSWGTMLAIMATAALLASALGYWITRSITGPIAQAVSAAEVFSQGDLTRPLQATGRDEPAMLINAMESMRDNLVKVVSHVRQGAESVAASSAEIAQGNNDLSARTEQQASALEETAASMEELSSQVKQNADSARQANQLASSASTVAVRGGDVVGRVVDTMKEINASSKKISDIISVIDGIAFQTNILALNAAVEAARAGEQGRGFAVVASEVRSLAGRSADAAKEIKSLINASVERVEQGSTLVDEAGVTMGEVVSAIRRVTDIMGEISAASSEQAAGVSQVGEAVTQMDQATQQNAALVEQMAAAASGLKSQAQDLVSAVAAFKLQDSQDNRAGAPAKALSAPKPAKTSLPTAAKSPMRVTGPVPRANGSAMARLASPIATAPKAAAAPAPARVKAAPAEEEWETF